MESLTLVPISTKLIEPSLLTESEVSGYNTNAILGGCDFFVVFSTPAIREKLLLEIF